MLKALSLGAQVSMTELERNMATHSRELWAHQVERYVLNKRPLDLSDDSMEETAFHNTVCQLELVIPYL